MNKVYIYKFRVRPHEDCKSLALHKLLQFVPSVEMGFISEDFDKFRTELVGMGFYLYAVTKTPFVQPEPVIWS